jgi:hypothetical protein
MTTAIRPFDHFRSKAWPHRFKLTLHVDAIAGGTPTDPKVAEGWLRTKLADPDDLIREQVAQVMTERGVNADEAAREVDSRKHLNGFLRDGHKGLYIGGRQLKAAIKESASVAVAAGKIEARRWGTTNKGLAGFVAEHIVVDEDRLYLGKTEPDTVIQKFVHTWRGNGIQYEEVCTDVTVTATILTDWDFSEEFWAMLWLTGEQQGIGASRSQGMGKYTVTGWEPIPWKAGK